MAEIYCAPAHQQNSNFIRMLFRYLANSAAIKTRIGRRKKNLKLINEGHQKHTKILYNLYTVKTYTIDMFSVPYIIAGSEQQKKN